MLLRETSLDESRLRRLFPPLAYYSWCAATLIAAVSGPFGTFQVMDFPVRLVFWAVILGTCISVGRVVRVTVEERFAEHPVWLVELVSIAMIVPILSGLIWALMPRLIAVPREALPPPEVVAGYVFVIAGAVAAFRRAQLFSDQEGLAAVEARPVPRLRERLPQEMGGTILRLSSADHMVEVVTDRGTVAIRMRFCDAIAEMEPVEGYCAHRSHWIARAAITEVERENGKIFLRLKNGDQVPVSRKYRPGLEEAGIL